MKDKRNAFKRLVCVMAFVMACAILLFPIYSRVTVEVQYEKKHPSMTSELFYSTESAPQSVNSIKKKIKNKTRVYELSKEEHDIQMVRFDPVNKKMDEPLVLKEIAVYSLDGLVASYRGAQLESALIVQGDAQILSLDENGLALSIHGDDSQLLFTENACDTIRRAFHRNYSLKLLCLWGLLLIITVVYFNQLIIKNLFTDKKKLIRYAFMSIAVMLVLFYFYYLGSDSYGFASRLTLLLCILYGAIICSCYFNKEKVGVNFAEKIISLLLLAETIQGVHLWGQAYEGFSSDILFFSIYFVLQLYLFIRFWVFEKQSKQYILFVISLFLFRLTICIWGQGWELKNCLLRTMDYFSTYPGMMSFVGVLALAMILIGLFGEGIGAVLYGIGWSFVFVTNMIEMIYHSTFVKAIDVFSVSALKGIIGKYTNNLAVIAGAAVVVLIGFLLAIYRKQILSFLKPKKSVERQAEIVIGIALFTWLILALNLNVYKNCFGIRNDNNWSLETTQEKHQGFFAFSYINIRRFLALIPKEPEGYSASMVASLMDQYKDRKTDWIEDSSSIRDKSDALDGNGSRVGYENQPDIIYLMLESVIDPNMLEEEYGVTYSENPDPVLDQMKITKTLAAVYGGYTARSEFEALTGMSDIFFPAGTVAYSAYFNSQSEPVYSVVDVFKRHGYETSAIHQNNRTFYNRDMAYRSMGFDKFIASGDYEAKKEDANEDGYLTNKHLLTLIKKELDQETNEQKPKFIWAVTIESHAPFDQKYKETNIDVTCDDLSEEAILELEQYIQSVKNTDQMIGELIDYLKTRNRPAIIVTFGDHLPRLRAWETWKTAEDPDKYYATLCGAYSTEGELKIKDDYISFNYLAPFLVHTAGIDDEPFYNYLEMLQKEMPVFRPWRMPAGGAAVFHDYENLQYDILFGKKYFKVK